MLYRRDHRLRVPVRVVPLAGDAIAPARAHRPPDRGDRRDAGRHRDPLLRAGALSPGDQPLGPGPGDGPGADRHRAALPGDHRAHVPRLGQSRAGYHHGRGPDFCRHLAGGGAADRHLGVPALRTGRTLLHCGGHRGAGWRIGVPARAGAGGRIGDRMKLPESSAALAGATWEDCLPYYEALAQLPLDAASLPGWLADWSRFESALSEAASLAMIADR